MINENNQPEPQPIPQSLAQQIHAVINFAVNKVAQDAAGKDQEQIFGELREALAHVGVQPQEDSVRTMAAHIWQDLQSK